MYQASKVLLGFTWFKCWPEHTQLIKVVVKPLVDVIYQQSWFGGRRWHGLPVGGGEGGGGGRPGAAPPHQARPLRERRRIAANAPLFTRGFWPDCPFFSFLF